MINHDLIIVGGGASGLIAAITAKDFGIDVAILEATDRIGKKILTTGNGRCNISNKFIKVPFNTYHCNEKNFFNNVLENFGVNETLDFFSSLGLPVVELQNGKLYPRSLQASSVVDILKMALEDRGIPLYTNTKVKTIHKDNFFKLSTTNDDHNLFTCNNLILACGGKSAPKTGSDGSAYYLAKNFGHSVLPLLPGIVQLKLDYKNLKSISGIKFDGFARIIIDDLVIREDFGEILFTDYGISGPPILQLSALASKGIFENKKVEISVDLMPQYTLEALEEFIECHFAILSHRTVIDSLIGVINKKLIPTLLKECGITNLHTPCNELSWKDKKALIKTLKDWRFNCVGTNDFNQAQVTIGGVDTTEVDNNTLESKIISNLYFTGEILDVHGDCGGFNLQWAWSSGYIAAKSIANKK